MRARHGARLPDGERGAAAVEMALVLPILMMLIFGGIMFGITWFRFQGMQSAAREGARVAAVDASYADIQDAACGTSGSYFDDSVVHINLTVDGDPTGWADCDGTLSAGPGMHSSVPCQGGDDAELEVKLSDTSAGSWYIPFWGDLSFDFHSSATFRCEQ